MAVGSVVNLTPFRVVVVVGIVAAVAAGPNSGNPWSCRLGRALRSVAEQSPSGAGDTEPDEDREAEHGVRRACTLIERDPRPGYRHREPDEERDQQLRGHRHTVLGSGPVEHEAGRPFEDGAGARS